MNLPLHVSSLQLPRVHCQYRGDEEQNRRIAESVQRHWNALGTLHPHWSVLTEERFRPRTLDEAAFYATGKDDLDWLALTLDRNNEDIDGFTSIFEFGCGVGRVTSHFAHQFERVVAVDISDAHLEIAKRAPKGKAPNVEFRKATFPDFGMTEPISLWFSRIVLQHNPPPVIYMILRQMFYKLDRGGVAVFQVPTHGAPPFNIEAYLARLPELPAGTMEMHSIPQYAVFRAAAENGCVPLEVRDDNSTGALGWSSTVFVFQKPW